MKSCNFYRVVLAGLGAGFYKETSLTPLEITHDSEVYRRSGWFEIDCEESQKIRRICQFPRL